MTESCRLSACNFTKNELLHRYFSRILTANFRIPIFQNTSQVAASAETYSGLCQTSKMNLFCEYNWRHKAVNYFQKKLHLRCFTRFCVRLLWSYKFYLSNVQIQSLLKLILKTLQCIWCRFCTHKWNFMPTQRCNVI